MEKPANLSSGLHVFVGSGSPYARRVQMALIEKGVPYKEHMMSFGNKDHKQDWYLELSPRGQVPLLVDNGKPLSQSLAILLYVEEKFPEAPLIPKDDVLAKSKVISFVCEMDDKLYGDVEHDVFSRALKKDVTEETLKEINEKADKELGIWESYLAKNGTGYLVGSSLTIADLALYPFLSLAVVRFGFDFDARGVSLPHLKAWFEAMSKRPCADGSHPPHWKTSEPPAKPFAKK